MRPGLHLLAAPSSSLVSPMLSDRRSAPFLVLVSGCLIGRSPLQDAVCHPWISIVSLLRGLRHRPATRVQESGHGLPQGPFSQADAALLWARGQFDVQSVLSLWSGSQTQIVAFVSNLLDAEHSGLSRRRCAEARQSMVLGAEGGQSRSRSSDIVAPASPSCGRPASLRQHTRVAVHTAPLPLPSQHKEPPPGLGLEAVTVEVTQVVGLGRCPDRRLDAVRLSHALADVKDHLAEPRSWTGVTKLSSWGGLYTGP